MEYETKTNTFIVNYNEKKKKMTEKHLLFPTNKLQPKKNKIIWE